MTETRIKRKYVRKNTVTDPIVNEPSMYTINERFEFLKDTVLMLANGDQNSAIICGQGGLGKSHTVNQSMISAGYEDISKLDDFDVENYPDLKTFRVIKGYSTPKGLYKILYENRNNVVVFDDCDSVLKDPVSLNLLKGCLDSYSTRIISWKSFIKDSELPSSFEFTGRVIFISNLPIGGIDQAIISRSMAIDVSMTTKEKVDRMRYLLTQDDFMPEHDMIYKIDALNLIELVMDKIKELSLRTLIQCVTVRKSNPNNNWKNLATYLMC